MNQKYIPEITKLVACPVCLGEGPQKLQLNQYKKDKTLSSADIK